MNIHLSRFLFCLIFFLSNLSSLLAQQHINQAIESEKKVLIETLDGDEFTGRILSHDSTSINLETSNGIFSLSKKKIKKLESYDYAGKFKFPNSQDTRYFFAPSGIPLKKGEGYYQNVLLTGNFVNYGVHRNLSVGGGVEFISLSAGQPIWFLTPKVGHSLSEKLHVAGGLLMIGTGDFNGSGDGSSSLIYGVTTIGGPDLNFSFGVGYGYVDGQLSSSPTINLSGTIRFSNGVALLTENYLIGGGGHFGIQGLRFMGPKHSFDIGMFNILGDIGFIIPFVGYSMKF